MENHHFQWENPLLMAIFNSYVKLPEGISPFISHIWHVLSHSYPLLYMPLDQCITVAYKVRPTEK
jgi:hypothetical protein